MFWRGSQGTIVVSGSKSTGPKCPYKCGGHLYEAKDTGGNNIQKIVADSAGHRQIFCDTCGRFFIARSANDASKVKVKHR